jgi:hypothetical protein
MKAYEVVHAALTPILTPLFPMYNSVDFFSCLNSPQGFVHWKYGKTAGAATERLILQARTGD